MNLPDPINLEQQLSNIEKHWQLKPVGALNGQVVELAKLSGEFMWHSHDHEDKLFQVLKGTLRINFRDGYRDIKAGEFIIIPRATEHQPVAMDDETWIMLFEPQNQNTEHQTP